MAAQVMLSLSAACNNNALGPNGEGAKTYYVAGASNNDFRDNRAYDNGFDGFTMFLESAGNRFLNNTAERNSGWGFLSDFDSPNDNLATANTALTNGAGAFGEVAFKTVDFAAYTDISNPWDCH